MSAHALDVVTSPPADGGRPGALVRPPARAHDPVAGAPRLVPVAEGGGPVGPRDPAADAPSSDVPHEDPRAWCGSLVRAAVEVLAGTRPAAQLARWLSADIYDTLARRAGLAMRIKGRPTIVRQTVVRRVHLCALSAVAAEASVVVHDGERVRAAAVRIEAHRGRWRATALDIG
jgi:hypothetical protein